MNIMLLTVILFILPLHRASADETYASCMTNTTLMYKNRDWCFNTQRNMSVASGWLRWDQIPDQLCYPNGRMFVGPNKNLSKAASTYNTANYWYTNKAIWTLWVGLFQLDNQATPRDGWNWRILHPEGYEIRYPAVMSEINWYLADNSPNDFNKTGVETNWQNYAMVYATQGYMDIGHDANYSIETTQGALCQYTNPRTVMRRYGNFRLNSALTQFIVQQFTHPVASEAGNICAITCRQMGLCVSFSFNSGTSDCQINALDPSDSAAYAANFTADPNYVLYTRGI